MQDPFKSFSELKNAAEQYYNLRKMGEENLALRRGIINCLKLESGYNIPSYQDYIELRQAYIEIKMHWRNINDFKQMLILESWLERFEEGLIYSDPFYNL